MEPLSQNQPNTNPPQKNKAPLILSILGAIAVIATALGLINQNKDTDESANQNASAEPDQQSAIANEKNEQQTQVNEINPLPSPTESETSSSTNGTSSATYKDGTYAADATYDSPAGQEDVHVTITLKDGVVTDSTFSGTPRSPRSQVMQDAFAQNYKPLVIGKKIDEIRLTQVSGSSLTPIGFKNALAKIEAEAKM